MLDRPKEASRERFILRFAPPRGSSFAEDVRMGLTSTPKSLPPRYFYDALGSALFVAICELPEYTLTRAETSILRTSTASMVRGFGAPERVVELGSGDCRKSRILLEAILERQQALTFVPIDVDAGVLESSARELLASLPTLTIEAMCGDFRDVAEVLQPIHGRTVVLFLGSTIGNLDPLSAAGLLRNVRKILAPGDALLLGADLRKPKKIIEPAYDDALGVTAAFNLNLLVRINRELGGHFDLSKFAHHAFFNEEKSRIEMHLVSRQPQRVSIDGLTLDFADGESIHTENSYKYTDADLQELADAGGFSLAQRWRDADNLFTDVLMLAR
jgi:L-histidine N-alpha-methyltransferase